MERSWRRRFKQLLRLDAITSCCGNRQQRRARRGTHTVLGDGDGDDDDDYDDYDNEYFDNLPLFQEEVEEEEEEAIGAAEFGCDVIREAEAAAEDPDPDRMDLATALAAERQLRASTTMPLMPYEDDGDDGDGDGDDENQNDDDEEGDGGWGWGWCCVCMEGRRKLAAFIPCGHTFCRQCARELWFGRGSCPLCNRPVRDVLRIF